MTRSVSFVMWLLLLLATSVAAAWGIHHADLTGKRSFAPAEIALDGGVCYYTPGNLFGPPTAGEAAQARAAWNDWSQVCRYDPSRGFGAYPTADELQATQNILGVQGTMDRAMASLWALWGSIGLAGIGHGLLVGSLSIFNPHFTRVGWWLLLPEIALAQGGWLGVAALGSALGALGPRYIRRRTGRQATSASRNWLTPKRIGLAAGGWLATVGVLAAVYPNVAKLLPAASPIAVERSMPRVGNPSSVSGSPASGGGEQTAAADGAIDAVTPAPTPYSPAAGADAPADAAAQQTETAQLAMPNPFNPGSFAAGGGGGDGSATGGGDSPAGAASGGDGGSGGSGYAEPVNSALQTIATYFPPSNPTTTPSTGTPAAETPGTPAPAPGTEASSAIAVTPIVDDTPLPTTPGTLPPTQTPPPTETVAIDPPANPNPGLAPGEEPNAPGEEPKTPEEAGEPKDDEAQPPVRVPEPATLGLFVLGLGALSMRRKTGNKR